MTYEEAIEDIQTSVKPVAGGKSLDIAIEAIKEVRWYREEFPAILAMIAIHPDDGVFYRNGWKDACASVYNRILKEQDSRDSLIYLD